MGAGNPPAPEGKYKTSYLWEQVWRRDSLPDILARFIHLEAIGADISGKKARKENMIFPRYYQLDDVRKIEKVPRAEGAGNNYLVMYSAGERQEQVHRLANEFESFRTLNDVSSSTALQRSGEIGEGSYFAGPERDESVAQTR